MLLHFSGARGHEKLLHFSGARGHESCCIFHVLGDMKVVAFFRC